MSNPTEKKVYKIRNHRTKQITFARWGGDLWYGERDSYDAAEDTQQVSFNQDKEWLKDGYVK